MKNWVSKFSHWLHFTTLEYHDRTKFKTVWLFDPNESYLTRKHFLWWLWESCIIFMGIIFNLTLIFYKLLIAKCRDVYLEQFMQAFSAPFKSSHQYWVRLLLLLRNISYLTLEFLNANQHPDYSLHVIISLIVGILLLKFVFIGVPSVSIIKIFNKVYIGSSTGLLTTLMTTLPLHQIVI